MFVPDIKPHLVDVTCGKLEGLSAKAKVVVASVSGVKDVLNDYGAHLVHEAGI